VSLQSEHNTLVATTVDTVTLNASADQRDTLVVTNVDGLAAIYYTFGSSPGTPTVAGDDTWVLPAVAGYTKVHKLPGAAGALVVKLISSSTPAYSVEGFRS